MATSSSTVASARLEDVRIKVNVPASWFEAHGEQEVHELKSFALLLRRRHGLHGLFGQLRGFVDILEEITDRDEPGPTLCWQIRAVAAGIIAILDDVDICNVTPEDLAACTVEIATDAGGDVVDLTELKASLRRPSREKGGA